MVGQGGYGDEIAMECFSKQRSESNTWIPFTGSKNTNQTEITTIRYGGESRGEFQGSNQSFRDATVTNEHMWNKQANKT